ncbi:MAG TPA: VPDSG-CTERM sorting domain-containing protein [Nitrososphaera sp.]|nr:VPDSG-CTERM sorting domain-containing protein [Nitrososphaera sp.]
MNKIKYIAIALIAIAGLGFQQAKADIYSFDLTNGNSAISGFPGPYANVQVNLTTGTTATITFTAYSGFLIGAAQAADVNVNSNNWSIGSFSWTGGNANTNFTDSGAGNADGFGSFNQTTKNFDGFTSAVSMVSFVLTNIGGSWANALSVLTANLSGWLAAAHIFVIADQTVLTGFAAGPSVPDGGTTVMLLGMALGALGVARRYCLKS